MPICSLSREENRCFLWRRRKLWKWFRLPFDPRDPSRHLLCRSTGPKFVFDFIRIKLMILIWLIPYGMALTVDCFLKQNKMRSSRIPDFDIKRKWLEKIYQSRAISLQKRVDAVFLKADIDSTKWSVTGYCGVILWKYSFEHKWHGEIICEGWFSKRSFSVR